MSMTLLDEARQSVREFSGERKRGHPLVCCTNQLGIEHFPKLRHQGWERVRKILVFAAAKAVACHVNSAAKKFGVQIEGAQFLAFRLSQDFSQSGVAKIPEVVPHRWPIQSRDAVRGGCVYGRGLA